MMLSFVGQPISESRRAGQPIKILTKEEQEKMRTSCRVSSRNVQRAILLDPRITS